ncbi:unnamed protein product [Bursaphelenchus xylophilus]|uniref:(pine wood nematode) hypothetical protein n=1 Tax=Bursaphelenchus xylophilus TaxID=6326 RepID=A0A7I8WS74_BURXY|nr:unnamed protein product [Bursaphelenchus xylophilus]CAG9115161.1 unnamed protein product [Bursaphelenchus xylophilus]
MVVASVFWTLSSCTGCQLAIEGLNKFHNDSMVFFTFSTGLLIVVAGILTRPSVIWRRNIPFRAYLPLAIFAFIVNLINNQSIYFGVPFPLQIVFRSGTLVANVILTYFLNNKVHSKLKYFSIVLITLGIGIFTFGTKWQEEQLKYDYDFIFYIGIALMTICLFLSSYMGIFQENMFKEYGRHPDEVMWGMNAIPLPFYLFYYKNLANTFVDFCNSNNFVILDITFPITELWLFLVGILALQYTCVKSVYRLNSRMNSLNLTMILTLRKFLNLFFSVILFKNTFGSIHLFGTVLVFVGTYLFYTEKREKVE